MKMILLILIAGIFFKLNCGFNINMSSICFIMDKQARLFLGYPTSHFPKESFLNFLLYGRTDVNFTYKDFMNSYGKKVSEPDEGYLIIGNDLKLGGMVLDSITTVAVPVPGGKIIEVPFAQLSKYFSDGYTIIASRGELSMYGTGEEIATYGEIKICDDTCLSGFGFADGPEVDPIQLYNFFEKWNMGYPVRLDFHLFGYLKEFDFNIYKGKIKINFYFVFGEGEDTYFLVNDSYSNLIDISSHDHKNFTFQGSFLIDIPKYSNLYNFTGWWKP